MSFVKISSADLNSRGATTLPNQPKISASALKQEFDAPAKEVVAPKFNRLIDDLEATTAAADIGAVAPTGTTGATVQAVLNSVASAAGTAAEEAHTALESAHTHDNKALLDTYTQTEANLASAVLHDHTHSNKALLDTYTNANSDIGDAVSKKHSHDNKSLLDTYTQTESNLADAVSKKHSHSNKDLLDTYTQTESNLADAVSKKHSHENKALLDTYTQSDTDIADAVTKKHSHSNKSVIDKFSESSGLKYNGDTVVQNAYKTIKVGSTNVTASGEDTLELVAGSNVTLTPDASTKKLTISASGGGSSSGDMLAADYDSDYDVKTAGGIKAFVSGKANKVSSPTNGNFAGLDSNGDLTDSGSKAADFAAASHTHTKSQITDLGTAAGKDVPVSGNASATQVVMGDDTRLSDNRTDANAYHTSDTAETTLSDDDKIPFYDDSASAKRSSTWSNIKAKLKSYFDGIYAAITAIGTNESGTTASKAYAVGEHFYKDGKFCTAKTAIASGETFTLNTNYVEGDIANRLTHDVLADITNLNVADNTTYSISTITSANTAKYRELLIYVKTSDNSTNINMIMPVDGNDAVSQMQLGMAMSGSTLYSLKLVAGLTSTGLNITYQLITYTNRHINAIKVIGVK